METTAPREACFHKADFIDKNGLVNSIKVPVIQELVRQGFQTLPDGIYTESSDPTLITHNPIVIPVINIENLLVGSDPKTRAEELNKLVFGAKEWGLFLIKNHGIKESLLDEVKKVTKSFFGLSFEEKKASVGTYMSKDNMGYGRNFRESRDYKIADWDDRLAMRVAPKEASNGLNVWPTKPTNFRAVIEEYVEEGRRICDELIKALAESLGGKREDFFQYEVNQTEITIKVNYYPPCPRPDLVTGFYAHSDGSNLTLLMQSGATNALQAYQNNKWGTVVWGQNELLVMSNGMYKSSWHRVAAQVAEERISIGLFHRAPRTAVIQPLGGESEGEGFKKVMVGEYLSELYKSRANPTYKPALKFAKH